MVDLVLYKDKPGGGVGALVESTLTDSEDYNRTRLRDCLGAIRNVDADIQPEEDGYPEGPSFMFFKLLLEPRLKNEAMLRYTHIYWMEWDVTPNREFWVDALIEAAKGQYWIKGSPYHGHGLDQAVFHEENHNWAGHINGNALYNMRDPIFDDFLRLTMERQPPSDYWKPFDISFWKVLNDFPYSWRLYQHYRGLFQYTDILVHIGFHSAKFKYSTVLDKAYLIHGRTNSAGNGQYFRKFKDGVPTTNKTLYEEEIRPNQRLSILMRAFADDIEYGAISMESAKRYLPNALEYVVVVPEDDVAEAKRVLPGFVSIVKEEILRPSESSIQQEYTILMADNYTTGDFILHLDPHTIFHRPVMHKDLFVFNKPILRYNSLENLGGKPYNEAISQWKKEMSDRLGHEVRYDFSRFSDHLFPREIYAPAREYIETNFNGSLTEFFSTPSIIEWNGDLSGSRLFSAFNYLGMFLHAEMHQAVIWNYLGEDSDPRIACNPMTDVLRPPFLCDENGKWLNVALRGPSVREEHLEHLRAIAKGDVRDCLALEQFFARFPPPEVWQPPAELVIDAVYTMILPEEETRHSNDNQRMIQQSLALMKQNVDHIQSGGGRIHLLTNDEDVLAAYSVIPQLILFDVRLDNASRRLVDFKTNYVHQSVNSAPYEIQKLWEWILIADYLKGFSDQGKAVQQILVLSTDVFWLVDPRLTFSKDWQRFESYNILEGGATAFSQQGLEDFVVYLCDAYRDKTKLVSLVENYGSTMSGCQPENSLLVPCEGEETMKYLSFMHVLDAWYSGNPLARVDGWSHTHWCTNLDLTISENKGISFVKDKSGQLWGGLPNEMTSPLCMIRFGHSSRHFISKVLEFLDPASGLQASS